MSGTRTIRYEPTKEQDRMLSWNIQEAENTDTGKWIVCCNLINAYLNLMLKKAYKRTKQFKEKLNFSIVRVCVCVSEKRKKKREKVRLLITVLV